MRCYLVTAQDLSSSTPRARRLASTNASARECREALMTALGVRKKDVIIEDHEVPLSKAELLDYLNVLYEAQDLGSTEGDE